MKLDDAIKKRILELAENQGISLTALCLNSNLTPSTIFGFMYGDSKCPKVITIKKICAGAGITLQEFFSPKYFNDNTEVFE
ncbi:MAG: helix-turn-helix transcriptional regulator [Clostridia bacterium]|nr:helix-turn-helix transcriptional regulator [Clostridia bacterium]